MKISIRSKLRDVRARVRSAGRRAWRPAAATIAFVRGLELRDWFLVLGLLGVGYGLAGYDWRWAAIAVGAVLLYLAIWHKGVNRGPAQ